MLTQSLSTKWFCRSLVYNVPYLFMISVIRWIAGITVVKKCIYFQVLVTHCKNKNCLVTMLPVLIQGM